TRDLTFRMAAGLVDYLNDLGISDCYSSPILRARPGSTHGYDICDHSRLNPELGTDADFDELARRLRDRDMGLIVDIVPNHMSIDAPCNAWWMDVLENGPGSAYACYFDISWDPVKPELENKVLLPILEDQYGIVLESGKLHLAYRDGSFYLNYHERELPVAPRTYRSILEPALERLARVLPSDHPERVELESILTALGYLPPRTETDPERLAERSRESGVIKRRIGALYGQSGEFRRALDGTLADLNGRPGEARSFDRLDAIVGAQPYRPAFWRVAAEEINYRRFFDINDMSAIRVELPEVFAATHDLILSLLAKGKLTGARVDHPDGLWNPTDYFSKLQREYVVRVLEEKGQRVEGLDAAVQAWIERELHAGAGENSPAPCPPLYAIAEKILSEKEPLPREWAVYGTTGYDFLNTVNSIFINSENEKAFNRIYRAFGGQAGTYGEIVYEAKRAVMRGALAGEVNSLAHDLERVAEKNRHYRDFTLNNLRLAIREVIAALGIYRTYIDVEQRMISERDRTFLSAAVDRARRRNPATAASLFAFIGDTLLLRNWDDFAEADRARVAFFIMRFQQMTGPIMAKGVEDTAFYIYNRLVSLNEVGGSPSVFGLPPAALHRHNAERLQSWPHSMLASSTHDTKRSEDVRARLDVLSEMPDEWRQAVQRWHRLNQGKKRSVDDELAPDMNEEYLFYQALVGTWPVEPSADRAAYRERILAYMLKAAKEAKVHTSWVNPDAEYDDAIRHFVEKVLADRRRDPFRDSVAAFSNRVAFFGRFNSLSQTLLKLASPGVPDIYQGTELYEFSLVDPDNRRAVDYALRARLLAELKARSKNDAERIALAQELAQDNVGRAKLYVIERALNLRRQHPTLFAEGDYRPLEARGEKQAHVFAFARRQTDREILVVVPRLIYGLLEGKQELPVGSPTWRDTRLVLTPDFGETYRDIFTGHVYNAEREDGVRGLPVAGILQHFPVALLERV
ncbi:MAG: malto-oligosyltrehalose synthase, partial [Rudaea sp.]